MGLSAELKPFLAELQGEDPADKALLQTLKDALDATIPKELLELLKTSNGGEITLGNEVLRLYSANHIPGIDSDYRISDKTPGLIPFGTDGGDGVFVYDTRVKPPQIIRMLFSAADQPDEWSYYGTTLLQLFQHLQAGTHETSIPTPPAPKAKPKPRKTPKTLAGPGEVRKFRPQVFHQDGREIDVCWLTISPDGTRALSHHHGNPMSHWDLATGQEIPIPGDEPFWHGNAAVFTPDGWHAYVAASSNEPYRLIDLKSGQTVMEYRVTDDPRIEGLTINDYGRFQARIDQIALSPSGKYLYTASTGISLILDAATFKVLHQLPGSNNDAPRAIFAADDRWIMLGYIDFKGYDQNGHFHGLKQDFIRFFSLETGQCLRTIPCVSGIGDFGLSADGRIAVAQWNEVLVFNLQTGAIVHQIPTPVVGAITCRFTPDGSRLVVGTSVGKILVLDAATYRVLAEMKAPSRSMQFLQITPDSRYALTAGERSGMIRYWRLY